VETKIQEGVIPTDSLGTLIYEAMQQGEKLRPLAMKMVECVPEKIFMATWTGRVFFLT